MTTTSNTDIQQLKEFITIYCAYFSRYCLFLTSAKLNIEQKNYLIFLRLTLLIAC